MSKRRVIVYGNSLFIEGVKASLQPSPDLELVSMDESACEVVKRFEAWHPDAVVLDATNGQPKFTFQILGKFPALELIALDPNQDRLLILSSRQSSARTMSDLAQVIQTPFSSPIESTRRVDSWAGVRRVISFRSQVQISMRQKKQVFAVATAAISVVLLVTLFTLYPNASLPLNATVIMPANPIALEPRLVFAGGIILGGIIIALWFRLSKRKGGK